MKPVYHDNIPNGQENDSQSSNCAGLQLQGRCLHM